MGRAWGNALGGWRLQGRGPRGRWLPKGSSIFKIFRSDMRDAHKVGSMAAYRSSMKSGGNRSARQGAISAANYAFGAMNNARSKGYFINPEIGLSGVGASVGYGRKISPKLRASVSIKVAINRTDGGPIAAAADNFVNNSLQGMPGLQSLIKYGVVDTNIQDTVIVRQGDMLRVKSGRRANVARRRNPAYRAQSDRERRNSPKYRAERRNQAKTTSDIGNGHRVVKTQTVLKDNSAKNIGNGHKLVKVQKYDKQSHKNEFGTYKTYRQKRQPTKKRSNKKGVASTITA